MMRSLLVFYFNYRLKPLPIVCNGVKRVHKLKQIRWILNSLHRIEYETRQNRDSNVKHCRSALIALPNWRISLCEMRIVGPVRIFIHINVFITHRKCLEHCFFHFHIISLLKTFLGVVKYRNIIIKFR